MNLKKDRPTPEPGWEETTCPKCGQACWRRPISPERRKEYKEEVCTECAIQILNNVGKH
jgi:hypothetical protein